MNPITNLIVEDDRMTVSARAVSTYLQQGQVLQKKRTMGRCSGG